VSVVVNRLKEVVFAGTEILVTAEKLPPPVVAFTQVPEVGPVRVLIVTL
jgi:hypothetical protein